MRLIHYPRKTRPPTGRTRNTDPMQIKGLTNVWRNALASWWNNPFDRHHYNSCSFNSSFTDFPLIKLIVYGFVTYVVLVQNFMLIPKNRVSFFLGHLKLIFRHLEDMTLRSHLLLLLFFNTCLTSRVRHQNDRNCSGNIIKLKKNEITFWNHSKVISRATIAKFLNIHISPWIGHHVFPPPPQLLTPPTFFKLWYFQNMKLDFTSKKSKDELYILTAFMGVPPNMSEIRG